MADRALFRDKSIASLTGSDQVAIALSGNRGFLAIQNTGNANVGVNLAGGTAAIAGTGTLTLTPGDALVLDHCVPQNAIHVIGTSGQPLSVIEG